MQDSAARRAPFMLRLWLETGATVRLAHAFLFIPCGLKTTSYRSANLSFFQHTSTYGAFPR
jgi:hypothetical protein